VEHSLEITSCRISVAQACETTGCSLRSWQGEAELAPIMREAAFLPDAWFQVERSTSDGPRRAGFFLEVERSGKSRRALEDKFRRHGAFYYGGAYERIFGTRALRILVLVGSDYGIRPHHHIAKLSSLCESLAVTHVRLGDLEGLKCLPPRSWLMDPIWCAPGHSEMVALFPEENPQRPRQAEAHLKIGADKDAIIIGS
jgi:hypothetical protein